METTHPQPELDPGPGCGGDGADFDVESDLRNCSYAARTFAVCADHGGTPELAAGLGDLAIRLVAIADRIHLQRVTAAERTGCLADQLAAAWRQGAPHGDHGVLPGGPYG
jgi:hypothetical protein